MTKIKPRVEEVTKCPECNSAHLIRDYETGALVCGNKKCGRVIEDTFLDAGQEQPKEKSRGGSSMNYIMRNKGLGTEIDWKNKDFYGKSIPTKNRAQMYRIRIVQRRTTGNATERNLASALPELNRMASAMGVPRNVRETAAMIYKKAVTKNLIMGRSIEEVAVAALYGACRQHNIPRTLEEIAKKIKISKKKIARTYRVLSKELNLKLEIPSPQRYIDRFCFELRLDPVVVGETKKILTKADEKRLTSGIKPESAAATAIYLACKKHGERKSMDEVAAAAGVTEVAIRNKWKKWNTMLDLKIEIKNSSKGKTNPKKIEERDINDTQTPV